MTLQADLDALNAAIRAGVSTVKKADGALVSYQSISDMIKARDLLKADIREADGGALRPPAMRLRTSKGL